MAKADILAPFIQSFEGGFANHPKDPGGATMKGVTLATYRSYFGKNKTVEDLKKISNQEWNHIFKSGFWDKAKADEIENQSVANLIVDWMYNSGPGIIKKIQEIIGVSPDGVIGPKTIEVINNQDSKELFIKLHTARDKYYKGLKNFPTFGKGWLRRNNSIHFGKLTLGNGKIINFEG